MKREPKIISEAKKIPEVIVTSKLNKLCIPPGARHKKKILGRGSSSGHGKTSCRGSKGQTSRTGHDMYLGFEGGQTPLIRRFPKRGFNSKFSTEYQTINLKDISGLKSKKINLELLEEKGLIKNKNKLVKVLGEGEVKSALVIQAHAFSKQAIEKIQKAGGQIEVVNA